MLRIILLFFNYFLWFKLSYDYVLGYNFLLKGEILLKDIKKFRIRSFFFYLYYLKIYIVMILKYGGIFVIGIIFFVLFFYKLVKLCIFLNF